MKKAYQLLNLELCETVDVISTSGNPGEYGPGVTPPVAGGGSDDSTLFNL